jgi:hypothetical protein
MPLVQEMAKYIARMEGAYTPGTVAWRNENPGNLDNSPHAIGRDAHGHAVYERLAHGWGDLEDYIAEHINAHPRLTLRTFFAGERDAAGKVIEGGFPGYAPDADPRGHNDAMKYAQFMADQLGLSIDELLLPRLTDWVPRTAAATFARQTT